VLRPPADAPQLRRLELHLNSHHDGIRIPS
jgi:hypothetical protein